MFELARTITLMVDPVYTWSSTRDAPLFFCFTSIGALQNSPGCILFLCSLPVHFTQVNLLVCAHYGLLSRHLPRFPRLLAEFRFNHS
jgi:hypothetical protein